MGHKSGIIIWMMPFFPPPPPLFPSSSTTRPTVNVCYIHFSATTGQILLKFETEAIGIKSECTKVSNEDDLKRKTTSNGRQPQNRKSGISQQPLVGSYSNLTFKRIESNQSVKRYHMKITCIVKRPPTEDDLKIWKVEYLSNHWLDLTQIWNLS